MEGDGNKMLSEHQWQGWLGGRLPADPDAMDFSPATSLQFTSSTPCSIQHAKWLSDAYLLGADRLLAQLLLTVSCLAPGS